MFTPASALTLSWLRVELTTLKSEGKFPGGTTHLADNSGADSALIWNGSSLSTSAVMLENNSVIVQCK